MKLVIVESPSKAKTIEKYLGEGFTVRASVGHIRDLPKTNKQAIDIQAGFVPKYVISEGKDKVISDLKSLSKKASEVVLATDPDREGEAIAWHLSEVLGLKHAKRIVFHEITKSAIEKAIQHPRTVDMKLVEAQQARQILDRIVGFELSPVVWQKVPGGKSAGRVQSPAVRLLVEREREITTFEGSSEFKVTAVFVHANEEIKAELKQRFATEQEAHNFLASLSDARYTVTDVTKSPSTRNPAAPFTTSTLQMEAARKLGFAAAHTMRVAQNLYEAGAITYMRTDGVQMDPSAISAARLAISNRYKNGHYLPEKPRIYETKAKNAQEAHEAIRPTDFAREQFGSGDEARLYELVWKRAIASQMASASLERTTVILREGTGQHELRAHGQVVKFPGFLAVYDETLDNRGEDDEDGSLLPALSAGDVPAKTGVEASQHFTQPPPRFSEATLVKRLEELGIGRPSTYAATIQVLKDRGYVRVEKNRFFTEESGRLLTAFLERFFPRYVAYDFTAGMEEELDDVSGGREAWKDLLAKFWKDFKPKSDEVMERKPSEVTEALDEFLSDYLFPPKEDGSDPRQCPQCGVGRLSLRGGRYGAFVACSNYPECKFTRKFAQPGGAAAGEEGELGKHPQTGEPITRKAGRFGPYIEMGSGKEARRSSIPKDIGELDLDWAVKLLSLPRSIGSHPETGEEITASIGRYGPYLAHNGKYAKLRSTAEVFETGMNSAVAKLAEAASGAGRGQRTPAEPLKTFGPHPESGGEIRLMAGRYGPYVTDGTTNATLPRDRKPEDLTAEEAVTLITEKAAKGPAKKGGRKKAAPKKKAAAKKAPAKKAPAKKAK